MESQKKTRLEYITGPVPPCFSPPTKKTVRAAIVTDDTHHAIMCSEPPWDDPINCASERGRLQLLRLSRLLGLDLKGVMAQLEATRAKHQPPKPPVDDKQIEHAMAEAISLAPSHSSSRICSPQISPTVPAIVSLESAISGLGSDLPAVLVCGPVHKGPSRPSKPRPTLSLSPREKTSTSEDIRGAEHAHTCTSAAGEQPSAPKKVVNVQCVKRPYCGHKTFVRSSAAFRGTQFSVVRGSEYKSPYEIYQEQQARERRRLTDLQVPGFITTCSKAAYAPEPAIAVSCDSPYIGKDGWKQLILRL